MSTTAAGRHFRDVMNPYVVVPDGWWGDMGPGVENLVARIEAEAVAAAMAKLAFEVEALNGDHDDDGCIPRAAVLAEIEKATDMAP